MSYQRYTVVGNLTRDPKRKDVGNTYLAEFGLACTEKRKDREETVFWDCVAWPKLADLVLEHLSKGSRVLVEARVTFRQWGEGEAKRSKHELVVNELRFLDSRSKSDSESRSQPRDQRRAEPSQSRSLPADDLDDVPF